MNTVKVENCKTLFIGRRGENEVTEVVFDFSEWQEQFGTGVIDLYVKRNLDIDAYPVVLSVDGTVATWLVTAADTDVVGNGKIEYVYTVDQKVAKSAIFPFYVGEDIGQASSEPPDPYESWIETLTELGTETQANAQAAAQSASDAADSAASASESAGQAEDSAEDAEAWAVGERGGEPVSESDPTYENNAKYWAEKAKSDAPVTSVNSKKGDVELTLDDIPNGSTYVRTTPAQLAQIAKNATDIDGKQAKITASGILKGDGDGGVSAAVAGTDYITGLEVLSYGNSTWNDFLDAYTANKVVYCRASSNANPASGSQTRMAFMAYVNDAANPTNVEFQYYRSVQTHSDSQQGDQVFVYKLDKTAGWSVTTRNTFSAIDAGTGLSKAYANGKLTLSVDGYRTAADQDLIDNGKQAKITASGILKGDGAGGVSAAVAGVDYLKSAPVTSVNGQTGDVTIQPATDSQVTTAVNTWLGENVAQETGYVLDVSLTMSNAAPPASAVGDLKSAFDSVAEYIEPINLYNKNSPLNKDNYRILATSSGELTNSSVSHPIPIELGKTYSFKMTTGFYGVSVNRVVRFCDAEGNLVTQAESGKSTSKNATPSQDNAYATFTVTENIDYPYCCVNVRMSGKSTMIFAEGETLPEYSEWEESRWEIREDALPTPLPLPANAQNNVLYGKKAAFTGDSICYGAGYLGGYAKIIGDTNGMSISNIAVSGGTLCHVADRFCISESVDNMPANYDYYIVEGGVNDAAQVHGETLGTITSGYNAELDTSTMCGAIEYMCKKLQLNFVGKKYGFIFPHNVYGTSSDWNTSWRATMKQCLEKWGIPYLDLSDKCAQLNNLSDLRIYTKDSDGWHPTEEGYRLFYASKIEAWMRTL